MNALTIGIIVIGVAVIFCFLLAVANFSGERFFEKYEKLNEVKVSCFYSSLEFVRGINNKHFSGKLKICKTDKIAGDAYADGMLILSENTLTHSSLASFTIISHEIGHARQDKEGNKLKSLNRLRKFGRFIGILLLPLLIAGGVIMIAFPHLFYLGVGLASGGGLIFLTALFLKLKTISIEKEASKYALDYLGEYLNEEELSSCKKFLADARLTYWADFLRTLFAWTFLTKKSKFFN